MRSRCTRSFLVLSRRVTAVFPPGASMAQGRSLAPASTNQGERDVRHERTLQGFHPAPRSRGVRLRFRIAEPPRRVHRHVHQSLHRHRRRPPPRRDRGRWRAAAPDPRLARVLVLLAPRHARAGPGLRGQSPSTSRGIGLSRQRRRRAITTRATLATTSSSTARSDERFAVAAFATGIAASVRVAAPRAAVPDPPTGSRGPQSAKPHFRASPLRPR